MFNALPKGTKKKSRNAVGFPNETQHIYHINKASNDKKRKNIQFAKRTRINEKKANENMEMATLQI
jgi:hypothetical protein